MTCDSTSRGRAAHTMTLAHPVDIPSTSVSGLQELRERNRLRVLEALRNNSTLTQAGISRQTGLSRTTVSTLVTELARREMIEATIRIPSGVRGGRPGTSLRLTPGASLTVSRLTAGESVEHINQLIQQNATLVSENANLKSLLASIAELVAGRQRTHSFVQQRRR